MRSVPPGRPLKSDKWDGVETCTKHEFDISKLYLHIIKHNHQKAYGEHVKIN